MAIDEIYITETASDGTAREQKTFLERLRKRADADAVEEKEYREVIAYLEANPLLEKTLKLYCHICFGLR